MPEENGKVKAYFEMSLDEILDKPFEEVVKWNATQFTKHVAEHQNLTKKVFRTTVVVASGVTVIIVAVMWIVKVFSHIIGNPVG